MPSDSYTLTISDVGVSTPSAGSVVNASVASNAAIAFSKLAALTSGNILVGNGSNVATSVALSGNVTLSNAGVTTIANDAVTSAKIANDAVTSAKIANDAITNSKLANDAVTSAEIVNDAVTNAKLANVATATIKGRATAGTGDPEDLTAAQTRTVLSLDNVTNTSDANKPVSTAQQTALDLKANIANPTFTGTVGGITASMVGLTNVNNTSDANKPVSTAQQTALDLKANIANPTFTGTTSGTFSGSLTGNVTGNVTGSAASFTGSLVGDVTGTQGATTIANDAVTYAKMQDMSGYAILGKPTSGSGNVSEITSSSFMLEASTGFLRQSSATSARSTLGLADALTGNVLLSGGVGVDPAYGKVGLTTHVSGTLPAANGGTGATTSTGSGANALATSPTLVTPILGTPTSGTLTSCTGLPLTTGVTGTLPVANGGTGVTTSTGSGANALATSPTLVTPILGTPTSGTLTSCTGLPLTTGVTGTLPVTNGGTGVAASAYGQTGSQTAGTSTGYTTTYAKLVLTTSLDAAAQFDANGVDNRLRYTGSATRRFLVFASMDMFTATDGAQFSIKIAKNGTVIDATQCNAAAATKASVGIAKLVSNWIIEFATNDYVELFVASVGGSETGTPQRMRLVATPVF